MISIFKVIIKARNNFDPRSQPEIQETKAETYGEQDFMNVFFAHRHVDPREDPDNNPVVMAYAESMFTGLISDGYSAEESRRILAAAAAFLACAIDNQDSMDMCPVHTTAALNLASHFANAFAAGQAREQKVA